MIEKHFGDLPSKETDYFEQAPPVAESDETTPDNPSEQVDQEKLTDWINFVRGQGVTDQDASENQIRQFFLKKKTDGNQQVEKLLKEMDMRRAQELVISGELSQQEFDKNYSIY